MSEGSSPWGMPVAPAAKHERDEVAAIGAATTETRIPPFPVERADGLIEGLSRLAGPLALLIVFAAIAWFVIKPLF
ncbi:hypothetical protein AB2M62_01815 [Sphingomonas sp. MMS12-HWE2-04]|uniref:hypothetical protein n=1 Tax=Sphingomonas sp. MMS12-HWE2-04 TaxID=3234199 RepID=UPI00384E5A87